MPDYQQLQETVKCEVTFSVEPTSVSGILITPGGAERVLSPQESKPEKTYHAYYLTSGEGGHRYVFTGYKDNRSYVEVGTFTVVDYSTTDLDYLIEDLRVYLGDIDPTDYQFSRETLSDALLLALKTLGRRWRRKYKIDVEGNIVRNINKHRYEDSEPPVVLFNDEPLIVVQAAIIVKSAELKNHTWDLQSWKDDEISFSNLGAGRAARDVLKQDRELLEKLLNGKLYGVARQSLPGFKYPKNVREGYK
jgi:hypothetical protein